MDDVPVSPLRRWPLSSPWFLNLPLRDWGLPLLAQNAEGLWEKPLGYWSMILEPWHVVCHGTEPRPEGFRLLGVLHLSRSWCTSLGSLGGAGMFRTFIFVH